MEVWTTENPKKDAQQTARGLFRAASLASLGLEMGIAVFVGWWVGQWLDRQFDTDPWLMLVFLLCGIAAAFKAVIRTAKDLQKPDPPDTPD